jgi:hypothetical protein
VQRSKARLRLSAGGESFGYLDGLWTGADGFEPLLERRRVREQRGRVPPRGQHRHVSQRQLPDTFLCYPGGKLLGFDNVGNWVFRHFLRR